jgi:hypothetical protein
MGHFAVLQPYSADMKRLRQRGYRAAIRTSGQVFNVAPFDVPERKSDLVTGRYEFPIPAGPTTVAVKITGRLGEEVPVIKYCV